MKKEAEANKLKQLQDAEDDKIKKGLFILYFIVILIWWSLRARNTVHNKRRIYSSYCKIQIRSGSDLGTNKENKHFQSTF